MMGTPDSRAPRPEEIRSLTEMKRQMVHYASLVDSIAMAIVAIEPAGMKRAVSEFAARFHGETPLTPDEKTDAEVMAKLADLLEPVYHYVVHIQRSQDAEAEAAERVAGSPVQEGKGRRDVPAAKPPAPRRRRP